MRRRAVLLGAVLVVVGAMGVADVARLEAQEARTVVGVVAGYLGNDQIWRPAAETERVGGTVLGAFVTASMPSGWFSVRAEGLWTRRGGDVTGDAGGSSRAGGIRSDYLTVTVHPRAAIQLGPISVHVAAGPTVDQLVRSRVDANLVEVLDTDAPTVFGVTAGLGLGARVGPRYRVEVEARVFEGLGDAYSGDFVSVRNRSFEVLGRVGVPWRAR